MNTKELYAKQIAYFETTSSGVVRIIAPAVMNISTREVRFGVEYADLDQSEKQMFEDGYLTSNYDFLKKGSNELLYVAREIAKSLARLDGIETTPRKKLNVGA